MKLTRKRDVTISARIPKSQLEEIDRMAEACGLSRSGMIRRLLELGTREEKLQLALDLVRERRVTVWKAAEMAGIDYRKMLGALRTRNVPFPLSSEDLELELAEIKATLSSSRNLEVVMLKGLWKGLKVDDRDIEAAKKSLFKHVSA